MAKLGNTESVSTVVSCSVQPSPSARTKEYVCVLAMKLSYSRIAQDSISILFCSEFVMTIDHQTVPNHLFDSASMLLPYFKPPQPNSADVIKFIYFVGYYERMLNYSTQWETYLGAIHSGTFEQTCYRKLSACSFGATHMLDLYDISAKVFPVATYRCHCVRIVLWSLEYAYGVCMRRSSCVLCE